MSYTIDILEEENRKLHNLNHRLAQSTIVYEQKAMIANQKLKAIWDALNTPNTTDEYVVQEVIRVMGLQMGDHGWEALEVE